MNKMICDICKKEITYPRINIYISDLAPYQCGDYDICSVKCATKVLEKYKKRKDEAKRTN